MYLPLRLSTKAAVPLEDTLALPSSGSGSHDDGLAAAVVEPADRGLVGHATCQAHGVTERVISRVVLDEATAPDGRTSLEAVNRDDRVQPELGI